MNFNKTEPCANCPFRTDIRPYLTKGRAREITAETTLNQKTFTCHKTIKLAENKQEHCAGALILLEKEDKPNQMMRIAERLRYYDRRKLNMDAPVFDSFQDFIKRQPGK